MRSAVKLRMQNV